MSDQTVTPQLEQVVLEGDTLRLVRRMLVLGLNCYGQIDDLVDAAELAESMGKEIPHGMRPVHPTGCDGDVRGFAEALQALEP